MAKTTKTVHVTSEELLSNIAPSEKPDIYANHVQMAITNNELFIDFFYVSPSFVDPTKPIVTHLQRAVSPIALAKGLVTSLANVIAMYEADHNITLPSTREPDPTDRIKIW